MRAVEKLGFSLVAILPMAALANVLAVGNLGGLSIRPTDVIFVSAVALWVFKGPWEVVAPGEVNWYLFEVGSLILLSLLGEAVLGNAIDWARYLRFTQTILWGVLAFVFIRSQKQFNMFLNLVVLLGLIMAVVSIALFVVNPELHRIAGYVSFAGGEGLETQASYNEWGAFFAVVLAILLWRSHEGSLSLGQTASLVVVLFGLLLTQSRSAFLACVVVLSALFFFYMGRGGVSGEAKSKLRRILLLFTLIGAAGLFASSLAINRLTDSFVYGSNAEGSVETRFDLWRESLQLGFGSADRFLLGYGNRSFANRIDSPTADSFYLDHWLSEGFLGLTVILIILIRPAVKVWRANLSRGAGILGVLVLLVALVVSLTGNVLVDPIYGGITFALLYGLFAVYGEGDRIRSKI
jgi:O-antigen ligase